MIRSLSVKVPGSTANLGPGFDALALALNLYCNLNFRLLAEDDKSIPLVTLKGVIAHGLPKDQNNLIYTVLSNLWRNDPALLKKVRITIESAIPLGKGLGSSAAAIMGAVWAAFAFSNEVPDPSAMLVKATELEGHSDNVSASLLGGLVVCATSKQGRQVVTQKLIWPQDWCPIVVVPQYVLSTKKSRAILPETVSREDAVNNIQRVALLVAAVTNKDEDALREALHDRLHEPYREELVPELPAVRKALADFPALGCVLSGAGSAVLTLVDQRQRPQVLQALNEWAGKQAEPPDVLDLQVDQEGLRVSYE